jgi:hypothetical protein
MMNKKVTMGRRIADVIYLVTSILGSALIASNSGHNQLGYALFLASSLSGIYLLHNSNASKSLTIVTLYFTVVNVMGLVRYA